MMLFVKIILLFTCRVGCSTGDCGGCGCRGVDGEGLTVAVVVADGGVAGTAEIELVDLRLFLRVCSNHFR